MPTCGVVIEKDDKGEKVCTQDAATIFSIVNPDDQSQVMAWVLLCGEHEQELSSGKLLIFVAEDGEHIAVQLPMEESNVTEPSPNES